MKIFLFKLHKKIIKILTTQDHCSTLPAVVGRITLTSTISPTKALLTALLSGTLCAHCLREDFVAEFSECGRC